MVSRENKNNAYAKFWRENKEYYGIFESGLWALRSGKRDYPDRYWGKVFCVSELEESVCLAFGTTKNYGKVMRQVVAFRKFRERHLLRKAD